ncbi:hypothetical protein [uncultured Psychroserpens sp.]|uniref:hypothetical protein n=1 Tax=uncultured Psychroserpens sp. TaxID=255436 RepID=UPI0026334A34|nr:hypothetical protein [uncultured Psychroserpens sp.]
MKNLLKAIAFAVVISTCYNCSVESIDNSEEIANISEPIVQDEALNPCVGANPTARLTNNGNVSFDLEIFTIGGDLLNHEYNVMPGNVSSWKSFAPGEVIIAISSTVTNDFKIVYEMDPCMEFDLEIGIDNLLIDSVPTQL